MFTTLVHLWWGEAAWNTALVDKQSSNKTAPANHYNVIVFFQNKSNMGNELTDQLHYYFFLAHSCFIL